MSSDIFCVIKAVFLSKSAQIKRDDGIYRCSSELCLPLIPFNKSRFKIQFLEEQLFKVLEDHSLSPLCPILLTYIFLNFIK